MVGKSLHFVTYHRQYWVYRQKYRKFYREGHPVWSATKDDLDCEVSQPIRKGLVRRFIDLFGVDPSQAVFVMKIRK